MFIGPTKLLILQSTSFCNLDCSYCYLPDRDKKRFMPIDIAKMAIARVLEDDLATDNLSLVWHAGEPLVVSPDFYLEIHEYLSQYSSDLSFQHHFQTNGVLIDDKWCRLFKELNARVGISIDGPKLIHDRCRQTRNNRGSFERAVRGLQLVQNNDIEHHVISVVTKEALESRDQVFEFFVQNRPSSVGFNFEEMEGINTASSLTNESRRLVGLFYSELNKLHKTNNISSREIRGVEEFFAKRLTFSRNDQNTPLRIITVDTEGDFSTFSPELHRMEVHNRPFIFGNVRNSRYLDVFSDEYFLAVLTEILTGIDACMSQCSYFGACGGGAPSNKFFENGAFSSTETVYCNLKIKELVDRFVDVDGGLEKVEKPRDDTTGP